MNIVCRLMCREEIETFMRGEEVVKGNKGEEIYRKLVGPNLSFSPIKYCDMISMGDLTTIFANMKDFLMSHSIKEARKRNSKVYMVVFEDNGETDFSPHIGTNYRTKFAEPSKELLIYSYSIRDLKPLRMYEIDPTLEMESDFGEKIRFDLDRTQVEGYSVKCGFPVLVETYEEAVNDMLHVFFSEDQIRQIYDGFQLLDGIEWGNECNYEFGESDDADEIYNYYSGTLTDEVRRAEIAKKLEEERKAIEKDNLEFYGRKERITPEWRDYDAFDDYIYDYYNKPKVDAEQIMKGTVNREEVLSGETQGVRQELSSLGKQAQKGKDTIVNPDEKQVK